MPWRRHQSWPCRLGVPTVSLSPRMETGRRPSGPAPHFRPPPRRRAEIPPFDVRGWVLGSQPQDGADSPGPGALRAMPEAGRLFESCTLQTKEDRPHLNRVRRKGDLCPFKGKPGAEHLDLQNSGLKRPRLCSQLEASSLDPEAFVSPWVKPCVPFISLPFSWRGTRLRPSRRFRTPTLEPNSRVRSRCRPLSSKPPQRLAEQRGQSG